MHFSGKWSHGALCRTDSITPEKWSGLRRIWQEGYYLLGEKRDGSVIWESTPTERAGLPPADDHITDWTEVTDWVIEGEYLMAIFRDGTIGWEGARRRPEKRRITEGWRNIRPVPFVEHRRGPQQRHGRGCRGKALFRPKQARRASFSGSLPVCAAWRCSQPFCWCCTGRSSPSCCLAKTASSGTTCPRWSTC